MPANDFRVEFFFSWCLRIFSIYFICWYYRYGTLLQCRYKTSSLHAIKQLCLNRLVHRLINESTDRGLWNDHCWGEIRGRTRPIPRPSPLCLRRWWRFSAVCRRFSRCTTCVRRERERKKKTRTGTTSPFRDFWISRTNTIPERFHFIILTFRPRLRCA